MKLHISISYKNSNKGIKTRQRLFVSRMKKKILSLLESIKSYFMTENKISVKEVGK